MPVHRRPRQRAGEIGGPGPQQFQKEMRPGVSPASASGPKGTQLNLQRRGNSPPGADQSGVYFSTRSRRVLPGLKWTYFLAGIRIVAPVAGLRP